MSILVDLSSAGSVDFGPDVTSSERSIKVLLNSQDKVASPSPAPYSLGAWQDCSEGSRRGCLALLSSRGGRCRLPTWESQDSGPWGSAVPATSLFLRQVFSQIRNEHFSSVFGFLSQKARNLQAQYDVSGSGRRRRAEEVAPWVSQSVLHLLSFFSASEWDGHQADEDLCVPGAQGPETRAPLAEFT